MRLNNIIQKGKLSIFGLNALLVGTALILTSFVWKAILEIILNSVSGWWVQPFFEPLLNVVTIGIYGSIAYFASVLIYKK